MISSISVVAILLLVSQGNSFLISPVKQGRQVGVGVGVGVGLKAAEKDQRDYSNENEKDSSRRRFFIQASGALSTVPVVLAANASPSIISSIQGPVQDLVAPGHWLGQLIGINSKTVQWNFSDATPDQVSTALVKVLNDLTPERRSKLCIPHFDITRADSTKVHVRTWTKNEWLDSLDVSLKEQNGGCVAKASFYATGFLPTSIPGAPIINVAFAWFPFASPGPRGEMLQDFRLRALQSLVSKQLQETEKGA